MGTASRRKRDRRQSVETTAAMKENVEQALAVAVAALDLADAAASELLEMAERHRRGDGESTTDLGIIVERAAVAIATVKRHRERLAGGVVWAR